MIIKTPKVHITLLSAVILLCVIAGFSINKAWVKKEAYTSLDMIIAQDWGFSSLTGLLGIANLESYGSGKADKIKKLLQIFPERVLMRAPAILKTKITGFPERPDIERIYFDIKFENYQNILEDRKRALEETMLVNPQEVPARITYRGKTHKAKIRLKGDLAGHWRSRVRMSLRVVLKGGNTIKGFKRFSIHKPGDRQYPYDQMFQDFMRNSGVLSARHDFVHVFVNGQNWGVMNIEEHMSKELLEKQEAKESLILKFTDERKWYYNTITPKPYGNYRLSNERLYISAYQQNKSFKENPLARTHYSYIANKIFANKIGEIIDNHSFSRAAMAASLWNNYHTLAMGNTRFYFNPYTLKIEPITTDQGNFMVIEPDKDPLAYFANTDSMWLYGKALASPQGQKYFDKNLNIVLQAANDIPDTYQHYQSFFPYNYPLDMKPLMTNIEKMKANAKPVLSSQKNNKPYEASVPTPEQSAAFMDHVLVRHYDDGRLALFNLLDVPVQLEKIFYDGAPYLTEQQTVPSYTKNNGMLVIKTNKLGIQDHLFTVETSYGGHKRKTQSQNTFVTKQSNPLVERADKPLPAFIKKNQNGFLIEAGQWLIEYPLVIKGGLIIKPGTKLTFTKESYMIVKGALEARGTAENTIIFKPQNEHWKGLYIIAALDKKSMLRHVKIYNTAALQDGLLSLTGGVTFYKSPVEIEHTEIIGTIAEDALNIVKSEFVIKNSLISDTVSDGFDSDFSKGKILSSTLKNVQGDAVDFSGGTVFIDGLTALNIHDKAVSAGEGSVLTIKNSKFDRVGVGIASKDGSMVKAEQIQVSNYKLHAAMAYVKKSMFGPATLHISHITQNGSTPFSRQKGSIMIVDGQSIKTKKVNVKNLYKGEVMSK